MVWSNRKFRNSLTIEKFVQFGQLLVSDDIPKNQCNVFDINPISLYGELIRSF
jgi:hypothetical protein